MWLPLLASKQETCRLARRKCAGGALSATVLQGARRNRPPLAKEGSGKWAHPATLLEQETSYPQQERRAMQNRCKESGEKLRLDGRWVASPWNPPWGERDFLCLHREWDCGHLQKVASSHWFTHSKRQWGAEVALPCVPGFREKDRTLGHGSAKFCFGCAFAHLLRKDPECPSLADGPKQLPFTPAQSTNTTTSSFKGTTGRGDCPCYNLMFATVMCARERPIW